MNAWNLFNVLWNRTKYQCCLRCNNYRNEATKWVVLLYLAQSFVKKFLMKIVFLLKKVKAAVLNTLVIVFFIFSMFRRRYSVFLQGVCILRVTWTFHFSKHWCYILTVLCQYWSFVTDLPASRRSCYYSMKCVLCGCGIQLRSHWGGIWHLIVHEAF